MPNPLLSLLYTYSLIIAIIFGAAGLPHILVRFYTNKDGKAARHTTLLVLGLIGIFYIFPPIFGVLGRDTRPRTLRYQHHRYRRPKFTYPRGRVGRSGAKSNHGGRGVCGLYVHF